MKRVTALKIVVSFLVLLLGSAYGQEQAAAPATPQELAMRTGYNSLYCSGFITDRTLQEGLYVVAGEEGGMRTEFIPGDIVYLSKGAGWIVNPGGEYVVLRRTRDIVKMEAFPGQDLMLRELGTMYQEIGRLRINIVHEQAATAQVLHACNSIAVGDVAIPFNVKPAIQLKPAVGFDRFAPPSGKVGGTIVTGREYVRLLRQGEIVYLNIGSRDGVAIGQYYRAFRPFEPVRDPLRRLEQYVPEKIMEQRFGLRLSVEDQRRLPREVLGEMVIIHVEGRSATALLTFSLREIFAGDYVELE